MATRSIIAIKTEEPAYSAIYCHWDGYPEGVGKTLKEHYSDPLKAHCLIGRGSLSALGDTIESSDFYTSKGEALKKHYADSLEDLKQLARDMWAEYLYVYEDGKWEQVDI